MIANHKKSAFYRLLISYILISLIPLLVMGSIFYFMQVTDDEKEVKVSNLSKLTQVRDQIDFHLRELLDVTRQISTNSDIMDLRQKTDVYKESQIQSLLLSYKERHPLVEEILLYQRGDASVYLSEGKIHYSVFEEEVKKNINWNRTSFFKSINTIISPIMIRFDSRETTQLENNRMLVYMSPLPNSATFPQSSIAYFIKESDLVSIFQNFFGDYSGYTYIFDNYYNVVLSSNKGMNISNIATVEKELKFYRGTGVFNITLAGKEHMGMRIVSKETGWSYVIVMPTLKFHEYANSSRNIILIIIIGLVIVGLILALLMSINNYRPIKTLLAYIVNKEFDSIPRNRKNEFDFIRSSFENTLNQNRKLISQIDIQRPLIKDECLLKILRGKVKENQELDYLLMCSNIQLQGKGYFVIVLAMQHTRYSAENAEIAFKLVENLYFPDGRGYGVELIEDKSIAIMLSLKDINSDIRRIQLNIVENIGSLLQNNLRWGYVIGVGNVYSNILQLNTSFLEASAAIYHNTADAVPNIHFFSDIENSYKGQVNWYPITEQALFIQSIKQGNIEASTSALECIVENISKINTSYLMIKCICFDIINSVIKTVNQMKIGYFDTDFKELAEFTTLEEFRTRMNDSVVKLCNSIVKFKENSSNELKNNIIMYVTDNFKDSNISLEHVANKFNISKTHVSRFFKDETSLTFIEYITNLRMDEVRKQLRSTNKPIKDIITDVGYIDATSFIRRFKSIEGVTPGQYREMSRHTEQE